MGDGDYFRLLVSQLHVLLAMTLAREKFGRGYLELTDAERDEVEGWVTGMTKHYFLHYTEQAVEKMAAPYRFPEKLQ